MASGFGSGSLGFTGNEFLSSSGGPDGTGSGSFGDRRQGSEEGPSSGGGGGGDGAGAGGRGGDDADARDKARKANPLVDLIETETAYVNELGMIIKVSHLPLQEAVGRNADIPTGICQRVASAWSKSNFPPAELDAMFRNVEAVYRVNRAFLKVSGLSACGDRSRVLTLVSLRSH